MKKIFCLWIMLMLSPAGFAAYDNSSLKGALDTIKTAKADLLDDHQYYCGVPLRSFQYCVEIDWARDESGWRLDRINTLLGKSNSPGELRNNIQGVEPLLSYLENLWTQLDNDFDAKDENAFRDQNKASDMLDLIISIRAALATAQAQVN